MIICRYHYQPRGRMKPKRNSSSRARLPPVFATTLVLPTPQTTLNDPAAICWIRNTKNSWVKNLKS